MNPLKLLGMSCCVLMLHGCFNETDHPAKDADRSKASVQMQKPDAPTGEATPQGEPSKANQ
ncbi:hypothetical protein LZ023_22710 [Pseudomonas silvicola]|nr:hypothetical protein LZ023_22710 [Pseudomonas silvicola]